MNYFVQFKTSTSLFLIVLVLACFAIPQSAQAVSPPPDGGYPGGNTAEGTNALLSLTTGQYNTAVGLNSLSSTTTGTFNTAIGSAALRFNTTSDSNTAIGSNALFRNRFGDNTLRPKATRVFAVHQGGGTERRARDRDGFRC